MSPSLPNSLLLADLSPICDGDRCSGAVKRVYREMKDQGQPEQFALDAASRVFRWHHPLIPAAEAEDVVRFWLYEGPIH